MNLNKWIIFSALIGLVGLSCAGCSAGPAQAQAGPVGETASVRRSRLQVTVDASGELAPNDEVTLAFLTGARVAEIKVKLGDSVQAGDELARLDDRDASEAVAEAKSQVRQAEINLAQARIEAEAKLKQAELESAQASYNEAAALAAHSGDQTTSARVGLKQAVDRLAGAQQDYADAWDAARDWELYTPRQDALENEREATEDALQDAQDDLEVAQADYNLAVSGLSQRDVQSAAAQVIQSQVSLEQEPLNLEELELALSQAQLKLASAQRTLEETRLTAPMAGMVTALNIKVGEMANAGQSAVVLSDLATLLVEINIDETDIAQVNLEQACIVTLDAFAGAEFAGRVRQIEPVAQSQSGVVYYPVTVQLAATDRPVRAGMTADVEIVVVETADTLIVPLRAVHTQADQAYVYRLNGEQVEQVAVTLGVTTDTEAEILSGLAEGDPISVVATAQSEPSNMGIFGAIAGRRE